MIRAYDDNGNIVDLVDWEKQIRADVIDEFLKKDKECQQKHEECPYMYSEISCVECIAEQLKEQNRKE